MTRDEQILQVIRQFVEDQGNDPAKVVPEALLTDLGIDSLHALDLIFRFEDTFEINISLEDFHAETVGAAITFLNTLLPPVEERASAS
jgi:acyl carrier protein